MSCCQQTLRDDWELKTVQGWRLDVVEDRGVEEDRTVGVDDWGVEELSRLLRG